MQCEKCKKAKATVFLTQIVNGTMQKVDLCEKCAKEMGVTDAGGFSLADMLLNMETHEILQPILKPEREKVCPACGYTEENLRKTGKLGCDHCYEIFSDFLKGILPEFHKTIQHRGKSPARQMQGVAQQQKLEDLEKELNAAIKGEKFEEAAWLRDQIKALHSQVK